MASCLGGLVPDDSFDTHRELAKYKSMSTSRCVDLSSAVEHWARDYFHRKGTRRERRLLARNKVHVDVDWRRIRFHNEQPVFQPEPPAPGNGILTNKVLFHTSFKNKTDHPQTYNFKAERTTRSECTVEIEQGYCKGFDVELKLATPNSVMEANAGFHKEISVTKFDGETIEEELLWGVNSEISVKPMHKAIAKLIINEEQYSGKFTIKSRANGLLRVVYTNTADNNSMISEVEGDLHSVIQSARNTKLIEGNAVVVDGNSVVCTTIGNCAFRYGLAQDVEVEQVPL